MTKPRLTLCMIVRDESRQLQRCLHSVRPLVDEIVIVDTGSTEATTEVAAAAGARVERAPWADSFSAARNRSLQTATSDWILYLDADEYFDAADQMRFSQLQSSLIAGSAYLLRQVSLSSSESHSEAEADQVRLFPRLAGAKWEYRVHEQILPSLLCLGCQLRPTDVAFRHTGYADAAERRQKTERNRRLLLLDHAEAPNDAYVLFNLGRSHLNADDPGVAATYFARAIEVAHVGQTFIPSAHAGLVRSLMLTRQLDAARQQAILGLTRFPDNEELMYQHGTLLSDSGELHQALESFQKILRLAQPRPATGIPPAYFRFAANYESARIFKKLRRFAEAEASARNAVELRSDLSQAWSILGESLIAQDKLPALDIEIRRCSTLPCAKRTLPILKAYRHLGLGRVSRAIAELDAGVSTSPTDHFLRLFLAEVSIRHGKKIDAARRHIAILLNEDPGNAHAQYLQGLL